MGCSGGHTEVEAGEALGRGCSKDGVVVVVALVSLLEQGVSVEVEVGFAASVYERGTSVGLTL